MAATAVHPRTAILSTIGAYVALTKPRIIELLLVTTVPVMVVAEQGMPSVWLMVATVLGGTLTAGGANAINMWVDRDIDAVMERTRNRPLVTGAVSPGSALTFAIVIEAVGFVWLWALVNLLSALLALGACLFYVFVYTLWLKRTNTQNIVIGGAAGAAPVLIGWSAVTDSLSWSAVALFGVVFFWTPPHFWALAIRYSEDYSSVDVPMLPSVASMRSTTNQMLAHTVALVVCSLLFGVTESMGAIYWIGAVLSGAAFVGLTWRVRRTGEAADAMKLFHFSITYLTLLFVVMALDVLVRFGV
ncbi:MAG: heme o synthase [Microthrixaceae bacterium]|nr:heme o synthase [Microthrixaceae bacterium]